MATCPHCRYYFHVPEDEEDMHDCPRCGYSGHEDDDEDANTDDYVGDTDDEDEHYG